MSVTVAESSAEGQALPAAITGVDTPAPAAKSGPRSSDGSWVWQITALSIVLGIMLALAINTTQRIRNAGIPGYRGGVSGAVLSGYISESNRLREEVRELRDDLREYEKAAGEESQQMAKLRSDLEEARQLAGLAPVKGPGLKVKLQDSSVPRLPNLSPLEAESYLIHDSDINGVLNELKAAGAEAIAISGADPSNVQRVVSTTAVRCVGPSALVNTVPLAAPYTIMAIGSGKDLRSALEMPNGIVEERAFKPLKMIEIEEATELVLPAYAGGRGPKYARPATKNP